VQNLRNRASPARLVKLYKYMSEDQRKMIHEVKFDGWLMVECFDAESSELVFPRRGRISVTSKSMADILNLPNKGDEVKYELDVDAINFIHSKYGIIQGQAPKIEEMMERVKQNNHANEDFLRSWLKIAVSTFLCPPTSLGISPRCYLALVDLTCVKKLNWCQFVVDQLKDAARKIDKKNSVRGCFLLLVVSSRSFFSTVIPSASFTFFLLFFLHLHLLHCFYLFFLYFFLQILYADPLAVGNVQIPATQPRIAAWTRKLLD
jgi:hypothetical protein